MDDTGDFLEYAHDERLAFRRPDRLPKADPRPLTVLLSQYEEVIRRLSPQAFANLNPGLTEADIESLELEFDIEIPIEVRQLYKWRNGEKEIYSPGILNAFPLGRFVPLRESLEARQQSLEYPSTLSESLRRAYEVSMGHRRMWLGVIIDPSGSGYHADCEYDAGQGNLIYSEREQWECFFHPSIATYIAMLLEADRKGLLVGSSSDGIRYSERWDTEGERELKKRFGAFNELGE